MMKELLENEDQRSLFNYENTVFKVNIYIRKHKFEKKTKIRAKVP